MTASGRRRKPWAAGTAVAWLAVAAGVSAIAQAPAERPAPAVVRLWATGPLSLSVEADKSELTVAQRLHIRIEVVVPAGYRPVMPVIGATLPGFIVADRRDVPAIAVGDGIRHAVEFTLEPFLAGDRRIPALVARATPLEGDGEELEVRGEPIDIAVLAVIPAGEDMTADEVAALMDVPLPAPPAAGVTTWAWAAGGGAAVLVLGAAGVAMARRRSRRPADPWLAVREQIDALRRNESASAGEFASAATAVIRDALAAGVIAEARGRTMEELAELAASCGPLPQDVRSEAARTMRELEELRFAPHGWVTPRRARESIIGSVELIARASEGAAKEAPR